MRKRSLVIKDESIKNNIDKKRGAAWWTRFAQIKNKKKG